MEWLNTAKEFVSNIDPQFFVGLFLMGAVISTTTWWHYRDVKKARRKLRLVRSVVRGKWMVTPERENIIKVLMADAVTDVIEELVFLDKMTPEEANIWYRRFGNLLNLPDLLMKHEKLLKDQLRKRGKHLKIVPDLGKPSPVQGLMALKAKSPA